jgi:hypothetical protein
MRSQGLMFFGALVIGLAAGSQAIAGGSIPLPSGNFSLTVNGSESNCGSGTCITLNIIEAGATVRDSMGNGCGTHTAVVTFSPPVPSGPILAEVTHVFKVTKYDPRTGIGDQSLTEYTGGKCNGAIFNSAGATLSVNGTLHFAVSENGNRIDNVVTALSFAGPSGPTPATNFSLTFTERSQNSQNQQ